MSSAVGSQLRDADAWDPSRLTGLPSTSAAAALAGAYPGAVLVVDAEGVVLAAEAGWRSPLELADVVGRAAFVALGLSSSAMEVGALQLTLAMACGNDAADFGLAAGVAPTLIERPGQPGLVLEVGPWPRTGTVAGVVLFVLAGAAPDEAEAVPVAAASEVDPEELQRFAIDAAGLLDTCDEALLELAEQPEARPPLHRMFRALHTLKANARGLHRRELADLAHASEELLDGWRACREPVSDEAVIDLRARMTSLRAMVRLCARRDGQRDMMHAFDDLARYLLAGVPDQGTLAAVARHHGLFALAGLVAAADPREWASVVGQVLPVYRALYNELQVSDAGPAMLAELIRPQLGPDEHGPSRLAAASIDVVAIARLVEVAASPGGAGLRGLVDEVDDPSHLSTALRDLAAMFAPCPEDEAVDEAEVSRREVQRATAVVVATAAGTSGLSSPMAAAVDGLAAVVGQLTWVPVTDLGRRASRIATTVAAELGKTVEVGLHLAATRVPSDVHRALGDILVHAVRNALDHGIEESDVRVLAGKPVHGQLSITIRSEVDHGAIVCEVRDDGAGIDPDRVRARAVARGLIDADVAAGLAHDAVLEILFHPGFSTAEAVTAVSGRGVGMDVIRALAEDLGGQAELRSRQGEGTTLRVVLPTARR
ncbi:MAG: Hpt domain-containing protein [Kofleriaceae bacterium]|nr:Hpt domain-containing protein [Kofleriaceae bacterium]